jgi:hypothetical protein
MLTRHLDRKTKCKRVDLAQENYILQKKYDDLLNDYTKYKIKTKGIYRFVNNVKLNNFNYEYVIQLSNYSIKNYINELMVSKMLKTSANYKIDEFTYTNTDIEIIDIFRMFIKLIYNNVKFPANRTLTYDGELDKFYYHVDSEWLLFTGSDSLLLEMIIKKIQYIIYESRAVLDETFTKLTDYVGINYSLINSTVDQTDSNLIVNSEIKKNKYITILKLEFMQKFSLHELNFV